MVDFFYNPFTMITFSNHQFTELLSHYKAAMSHMEAMYAILITAKQQTSELTFDPSSMYPTRPMRKKEIANMLGISSRHLASHLKLLRPQLRNMGVSERAKLLPPHAVFFICSSLDIEKITEKTAKN